MVMLPNAESALKILCSVRLCAAIWSHITDCDETFNYWEPLHFLMYNTGLQTWEYDPKYALRSYFYLLINGIPGWIYKNIFSASPILIFYFIRCMLALTCAVSEFYIYKSICKEFGVHIGRLWILFQIFCPGMFISSSAFLPSSFSMYFINLALAAWWNQKYNLSTFFIAVSSLLGWPFVAILGLPIAFDITIRQKKTQTFVFWSLVSAAVILIPMTAIDSSYFGKLVISPVNLVLYNVFTSHGPNLYGVEPTSFYLINGFLNYNIIWLMSLLTPVMLLVGYFFIPTKSNATLNIPYYLSLAPFYMWLLIFFLQPHKEERFLFPIYPMISLCGAISVDVVQKLFNRINIKYKSTPNNSCYLNHTTCIAVIFVIVSSLLSISRIISLHRNYHAPLDLVRAIDTLPNIQENLNNGNLTYNFCLGKDWYRFPTSFFFPSDQFRVRFLKSEFKGILPAYYENDTAYEHDYFNDKNEENFSMYFEYEKCDFLLDLSTGRHTKLEPNYSDRLDEWSIVKSMAFVDSTKPNNILRAFYVPFASDHFVKMAKFNLLKRNKKNM
ncbi:alpha-1,2-mannosyltransferase ALG9 isoform X2 [Culicoides brevitarsis]